MENNKMNFGVIGSGAWGAAFTKLLESNGNEIMVWDKNPKVSKVKSISDLQGSDIIVLALPFQVLREFLISNATSLADKPILLLSKGIEIKTMCLGHEILEQILPQSDFAVLSGPNFANEIMQGLPAATVVAGKNAESIRSAVMGNNMRVYVSNDVIGVEVCGAIKNVIAIAAGITMGSGYGENAKAALICRSLVEIGRLVEAMGGLAETVLTLAGIGDLMLTCGSSTSRNFAFGFEIGKAKGVGDLLAHNTKTIEGVHTADAINSIAMKSKDLDMPICTEVYQILFERKPVAESLRSLMRRGV